MILTIRSSLGGNRIESQVLETLRHEGVDYRFHDLTDERYAPCDGCFECWFSTPGLCKSKDGSNALMRDIIRSDAILFLAKPRFGAWDAYAKAALDKALGLLSPFFIEINGETRHRKRYEHYPQWAVLASVPEDCPEDEIQAFRMLVDRNTFNAQTKLPWIEFVHDTVAADRLENLVTDALLYISRPDVSARHALIDPLPPRPDTTGPELSMRRAILLIGSAKPRGTSASEALGDALIRRLRSRHWRCEKYFMLRMTKLGRQGSPKLVTAVQNASLLVIACPVYYNSLPALILKGLTDLADSLPRGTALPAVLPIIQCGFPESTHTRLAVGIIARATSAAGFPWAGHLALGEGAMMGNGVDLETDRRFRTLCKLFDQVAATLDQGRSVPAALTASLAKPLVSPRLYRWIAQVRWVMSALRRHVFSDLWQRPFENEGTPTILDKPPALK